MVEGCDHAESSPFRRKVHEAAVHGLRDPKFVKNFTRSYRLCRKKEAKLKKKQQENSVIASAQGHPKIDYALQVAAENIL